MDNNSNKFIPKDEDEYINKAPVIEIENTQVMSPVQNEKSQELNQAPMIEEALHPQEKPSKKVSLDSILKDKKVLIIIVFTIALIVLIIVLYNIFGSSALSRKNTTGSLKYTDEEVDYNCHSKEGNEEVYLDILVNRNVSGSKAQFHKFYKVIYSYPNGVTDEEYKNIVDVSNSLTCLVESTEEECRGNHLDLSYTPGYGYDTVIDRENNRVIVSYYTIINSFSYKSEASENEIAQTIKDIKKDGFKCK